MLRSFIRYVTTTMVLLAASVAGLPLVLCVSDAHSAAIEIERLHLGEKTSLESHFVLFATASGAAEQAPCIDYRLQKSALVAQKSLTKKIAQDSAKTGSGDPSLTLASDNDHAGAMRRFVRLDKPHGYRHDGRSTLSDRRTIVLQI